MICFLCGEEGASHRLLHEGEVRWVHKSCALDYIKGPEPGHNDD